ncbi:MAG: ABC transporter permease [Salibacteraceae bacterium]
MAKPYGAQMAVDGTGAKDLPVTVIDAEGKISNRFRELIRYRDLLLLFVKRDFISLYKQTILGPLWYILQPLLTTITFAVIFGRVAGISTDGIPKLLFYLSGITFWTYFSETLTKVSDAFFANQKIFTKVYFPRLIVPVSIAVSNLLKLLIQFVLFLILYLYYLFTSDVMHPNFLLLFIPVFVIIEGVLALSLGMFVTALTTKYRDLKFLIQFGVQLLMYASPIVYPLSVVEGKFKLLILANPMTGIIEGVKYAFFGVGDFHWTYPLYSLMFALVSFFAASKVFLKVERNFVDTI